MSWTAGLVGVSRLIQNQEGKEVEGFTRNIEILVNPRLCESSSTIRDKEFDN